MGVRVLSVGKYSHVSSLTKKVDLSSNEGERIVAKKICFTLTVIPTGAIITKMKFSKRVLPLA